jgi:hypothetical protein
MMADSVHKDERMAAVQTASPASIAGARRLTTACCQGAACPISQSLHASTPMLHAKLMLMTAVAATCAGVDSIAYFTVKA